MMNRFKRISLPIALAVFLAGSSFARTQTLPEGKGKAEFERICSGCHTVTMSTRVGRTHDDWVGIVNDMVSRGAQGSRNDLDGVVEYLSANFNKGSAAPSPSTTTTAQTAPAPAARPPFTPPVYDPLPSLGVEEAAKAVSLIKTNNCLSCHRLNEAGSYQGPRLDGIGSHRTPEQIRAAMVAPGPLVSPENRTARFVTRAGKTVSGRILNQDGFSVELIDTSDHLVAFPKGSIRDFTIVDKNTMPSYQDKISPDDLNTLVRYLGSLGDITK